MRIQKHFRNPVKKPERKLSNSRSRARKMARKRVVSCKRRRISKSKYCRSSSKPQEVISDKLEALKSLIPRNVGNGSDDEVVKVEQLFQETADYIIVLKTQAFVLQKLIEFYDNGDGSINDNQHQIFQEDQS